MRKNVDDMAHGLEMGERLLSGANDLEGEAKMFTKNTKDVKAAAKNYSFWACSTPCIVMFVLLALVLGYFLFK